MNPDPTPFFSDFKDAKKLFFIIFFSYNLPTGTIVSLKKFNLLLKFCVVSIISVRSTTLLRKGKDPESDRYRGTVPMYGMS
jgi:hypothetical protein